MSPTYHEDLGRPYPDPAAHNQTLRAYTKGLMEFAQTRKLHFIDLFHPLEAAKIAEPTVRLTTNGLLLTRAGYASRSQSRRRATRLAAAALASSYGLDGKDCRLRRRKIKALEGAATSLRFEAVDTILPVADPAEANMLRITGLTPGKYRLKVDGQEILQASAAHWGNGVNISKGPAFADAEKLRAALVLSQSNLLPPLASLQRSLAALDLYRHRLQAL